MVFAPDIKVAFSGFDPSSLRPAFGLQGATNVPFRCVERIRPNIGQAFQSDGRTKPRA